MGSSVLALDGNRRPDLQRGGLHRGHGHHLEEAQRPRQELAARVQGPHSAGLSDQVRIRASGPAVQGEHPRHPDSAGFPVHRPGRAGPGHGRAGEVQAAGGSAQG